MTELNVEVGGQVGLADEGSDIGSAPAVDGETSAMNDPALGHAGSGMPMQVPQVPSDDESEAAIAEPRNTAASQGRPVTDVPSNISTAVEGFKVPYDLDHDGADVEVVRRRQKALVAMRGGEEQIVAQKIRDDYEVMLTTLLVLVKNAFPSDMFEVYHTKRSLMLWRR